MGLAGQVVVLAGPGVGGGQLVALEGEQGPLALAVLGVAEQAGPAGEQGGVGLPAGLGRRRAGGSTPPKASSSVALAVGVEQGPALVLAVDVDQPLAQGAERGDGHRQAVGVRGRPALGRDPAGQDQLVVVDRPAQDRFEVGAEGGVGDVEDGGGPGLGLAGADEVGRRLAAEDQAQGGQQQALAGAGLAGPGAVAGAEVDRGRPRSGRGSARRVRGARLVILRAGPGVIARRAVLRASSRGRHPTAGS